MARKKNNASKTVTLTIDRLGRQGDGLALVDKHPVSFPLTSPGDCITAALLPGKNRQARDIRLITPGEARQTPPCQHFGDCEKPGCGGCQLQHIKPEIYQSWKRNRLVQALKAHKLEPACVKELISTGTHNRRRATFTAQRIHKNHIALGFYKRASHSLSPIDTCHVISPDLHALLSPLKELAEIILETDGQTMQLAVTVIDKQADIGLILSQSPGVAIHATLTEWSKKHAITRLYWQKNEDTIPEILYQNGAIIKTCAATPVALPPGSFLQPSEEGEKALIDIVKHYAAPYAEAKQAADLFCGIGTFSFPALDFFPHLKKLVCVDSAENAVKALDHAAQTQGIASINSETRNLFDAPLSAKELKKNDVVILDPPRLGAKEQARELAASRVPVIIYVSCHPDTMARDIAILAQGGYTLQSVTPVDQFTWSHHLESVALLTR